MSRSLAGVLLVVMSFFMGSCTLLRSFTSRPVPVDPTDVVHNAPDTFHYVIVPHHAILPAPDTTGIAPDTAGLARKMLDSIAPIFNHRIEFTTFSCKAKISFEGPDESKEFTANIRMKKDSAIWVAISALGLQVARAYITPDSFFMVVPIQHEGTKISLAKIAQVLPAKVDFKSLQNLIIGDPLRDGTVTAVVELGASWLLSVADTSYLQRVTYRKATPQFLLSDQINTRDPNGPQAILDYAGYTQVDDRQVAASRTVHITNGADKYTLEMEVQDAEFNKPVEMPFSIPKSYKIKN